MVPLAMLLCPMLLSWFSHFAVLTVVINTEMDRKRHFIKGNKMHLCCTNDAAEHQQDTNP